MKFDVSHVVLFVLINQCGYSDAAWKRWIHNTNADNPLNWDAGRLPCANDKLNFIDAPPVVYIQNYSTVVELVLPMDGALVLQNDSSLSFAEPGTVVSKTECPGKEIRFNRTEPKNLFNPDNWCLTQSLGGACVEKSVLPYEAVPCVYDNIVFPKNSSFFIDIHSKTSGSRYLGTVYIRGKKYNSRMFHDFVGDGKGEFRLTRGRVYVRSSYRSCDDMFNMACFCKNQTAQVQTDICDEIHNAERCPALKCSSPIESVGACCRQCGVQMKLKFGLGFNLRKFHAMLHENYLNKGENAKSIMSGMTKLKDGRLVVVLVDYQGGEISKTVAKQLYDYLINDLDGQHKFNIKSIVMDTSGKPLHKPDSTPSASKTVNSTPTLSKGAIAGIILAIIFILLIVCLIIFILMKRRRGEPLIDFDLITFSKFTGKDDDDVAPSVSYVDVTLDTPPADISRGFDNPMYDNPMKDFFHDPSFVDPDIRVNPVYGGADLSVTEIGTGLEDYDDSYI
ncbi:protein amnionless-like [Tubulanus polymorphus]|uniref:protein amnionless-like n=1 Tax=Tubulanus polymorphus TaxID=672921 RepID=UPI003DA2498C